MNQFFSQMKNETQKIRLTARERENMRRALEAVMRGERPMESPVRLVPSPLLFFAPRFLPAGRQALSALAFVLVLAVVGGSTAYAAEGAVPGDALYAIKVQVNERVAAALARTPEAQANWYARAAERRMEEAEALAVRGELTADRKAELEAGFEAHTARVETALAVVEEDDPILAADIASRFGSVIEAHGAVIARLGEESEDKESRREAGRLALALAERERAVPPPEVATMALAAPAPKAASDENRMEMAFMAEDGAEPAPSAANMAPSNDAAIAVRLTLSASTTLEEAETRLSALREKLGATTSARVKAQIEYLRRLIATLREEQEADASAGDGRAEKALKDATTVKTFIKAQERFEERMLLPVPDLDTGRDDADLLDL